MQCPLCGRPVLTFRLNPDRGRVEPFCPDCRLSIELPPAGDARRCPQCGMDFAAARSLRLLGCEHCHDTFAPALQRMLAVRIPGGYLFERPAPSSLALSRLRILQELFAECEGSQTAPLSVKLQAGLEASESCQATGPFVGEADEADSDCSQGNPRAPGLSLRIRLMRNIPGLPYAGRMNNDTRNQLDAWLLSPGSSVPSVLRSILNQDFHREAGGLTSSDGVIRAWTGDEDHLRLSFAWMLDSDQLTSRDALAEEVVARRNGLGQFVEAFDREFFWQARPLFGFLAACPSNTGSGLRMSIQFSTGGLEKTDPRVWLKWIEDLRRPGLEIRGRRGEGSPIAGCVTILLPDDLPGREPTHRERVRMLSGALGLYVRIRQECRY